MPFSYFLCLVQLILFSQAREVSTVGDVVLKHWFKCNEGDEQVCDSTTEYCSGYDCTPTLDSALSSCAAASNPDELTHVAFSAIIGIAGSGSWCDNYRDVLVYDNQSIVPPELFALQGWSFPLTSTERIFDFSRSTNQVLLLEFDRSFPKCNGAEPLKTYKAFVGLLPDPAIDNFGNKLKTGFTTSCFDQRPPFGVSCIYDIESLTLRCPMSAALNQVKILRPGERYQLVVELDNPCPIESGKDGLVYRLPKPITFVVSVATRLHVLLQTLREATTSSDKSQICIFNTTLDAEFIAGWYPIQLHLAQFYKSFLRNVRENACLLLGGTPISEADFDSVYGCGGIADDTCGLETVAAGEWRDGVGMHYRQRLPLKRTQFGATMTKHMAPQKD